MLKAAIYCASFVLALASVATAARADVTIDPPDGWKAVSMTGGSINYAGAWAQPTAEGTYAQNINLLSQTVPDMTLDAYTKLNENQLKQMDQNIVFGVDEQVKCGSTMMHRIKYSTTFGSRKLALEQVWVLDGGSFWVGTYARLIDQPELPAGSKALMTMCNHLGAPPA